MDTIRNGYPTQTSVYDLDCVFCRRWFATFGDLSSHVKRAHASARDSDVIDAISRASEQLAHEEGDRDMALPQPTAPARQEPEARAERGPRREFLKAARLGKPGARRTIQLSGNVRVVDGNFGPQVVVNCEYEGKGYILAVNLDSPNYTLLVERFSDDETKWFGSVDVAVKAGASSDYLIVCENDDHDADHDADTSTAAPRRRKR